MAVVISNIQKLLDERANAWQEEGQPLADIAAERAFTAEEQQSWERAESDFRSYSERIKALELSLEQERAVEQFADALRSDQSVRAAFESELRSVLVTREHQFRDLEFNGKELKRALSVGGGTNGSAGGATAPEQFLAELIRPLRNFASVLGAGARIITTSSGTDLVVPRLNGPGAAAPATEATNLTGTDPSFNQVTLKSYKFGDYRGMSKELVEDSAVDIEGLIVELIGENIGALLGAKLAVGTGTNETTGLITAATVGKTGANGVGGAFTFDDLIDLHYSVSAPYRVNGAWLFADAAIGQARKLKGTDGQYIWSPSVQVGQPDLILGKPVFTDAYMDAAGASKKPIGFGDVSRYWVRFVNSLRVERSEHALFGSDQIAYRGVLRADGALTDASAFKTFAGGTA